VIGADRDRTDDLPSAISASVSHLGSGSVIGLRARYLSKQTDECSGGPLDSHTVFDASTSHPIVAGLGLFALGENLFNRKYGANNFGGGAAAVVGRHQVDCAMKLAERPTDRGARQLQERC
jgi:hypothetical protein